MRVFLQLALGIIAAIGGFIDIGDLVFTAQAGATFGYQALWALPIGLVGIVLFAEMSGRVAAVAQRPNMELVRERFGERLGLVTLVGSILLSGLTLAAEIGGAGLVLNLLFDATDQAFMLLATLVLIATAFVLPFGAIERIFGYGGLCLFVYAAVVIDLDPDWSRVAQGFVPDAQSSTLYWYVVVGLIAATLMPYEIYFYSSGGIEEGWTERDLQANRINAVLGFGLGGVLAVSLIVAAALVLLPAGVEPSSIGTTILIAQVPFGELGLLLAAVGILFALGGAAIDTCFSGAYNLAQYLQWDWGKHLGWRDAPRWTVTWVALFVGGYLVIATGIDPVQLTEYAVVFSVVVLPLTYLPILLVAGSRDVMGEHVNGVISRSLGWVYFALICVLAVAAPVLLVITNGGGG